MGLKDSYQLQGEYSGLPLDEMLAKAQAATEKALALDDRLAEAYTSLAGIKQARNDLEGAEATYLRALELNPNYATAYDWYGYFLSEIVDRPQEALALHRKSLELNPLSAAVIVNVGEDLSNLGRFDEALTWYENALEVDPGYAEGYWAIAIHYWFVSGRLDEAVVWFAKGVSLDPGAPTLPAWLGWLFMDFGDPGKAESWINRSIELGPERFWPNWAMQLLHLYRGNDAAALEYGRKVFAIFPFEWPVLALLRDHALRAGRYMEARALYKEVFPKLLNEDDHKLGAENYRAAIDLALVLSRAGEQERADLLLNRSLQQIQTLPRLDYYCYGIADVQIHALRGDKLKALSSRRKAIDEGGRT